MKVKELIEKLKEFDSNLEIEFEFEELPGIADDGCIFELQFDKLMKRTHDEKESVLLNLR